VPATPLFDVVGRVKLPPLHIGAMAVKVGVTTGFTVMVNVVVLAH
jgi:hypothetical protein